MKNSSSVPENNQFDKAAHGYSLSLRPIVKATLNKRERIDEVRDFLQMREEKPAHFLADQSFVGLRKES
jgi:hypothetical protein